MDDAALKVPLADDSAVRVGHVKAILDDKAIGVGLIVVGFLAGELSGLVGFSHLEDVLILFWAYFVVL